MFRVVSFSVYVTGSLFPGCRDHNSSLHRIAEAPVAGDPALDDLDGLSGRDGCGATPHSYCVSFLRRRWSLAISREKVEFRLKEEKESSMRERDMVTSHQEEASRGKFP